MRRNRLGGVEGGHSEDRGSNGKERESEEEDEVAELKDKQHGQSMVCLAWVSRWVVKLSEKWIDSLGYLGRSRIEALRDLIAILAFKEVRRKADQNETQLLS
ncbi:hypothetical protein FEM48_Zijuj08G0205500 [Ziziphus jujuba var. spinosa]|uniref:Uncharacterized protein n=1 Tax=Ziziphus jujuba var. spinosa TaxID=714518 RepID=A0A978V188_ZIZJJ|nr:hypothetical protein FEM48_Zijuj08G0205500 [Ziziphus jujuba var. spinosa]